MSSSLDVIFTPSLLPFHNLTQKTVVVADILRATTTVTFALANGARDVTPVLTTDDAFQFAQDSSDVVIGGERQGLRVEGFALGNSPLQYTKDAVADRSIVLTTTNGTRALLGCRSAKRVLIGSFLNLQSVIKDVMQTARDVVFVCAGKEGGFCLEDTVFAGACVDSLKSLSDEGKASFEFTDAAEAAGSLYRDYSLDLIGMLNNCCHGKSLARIGFGGDLEFCAQINLVDILPCQVDGRIVTL